MLKFLVALFVFAAVVYLVTRALEKRMGDGGGTPAPRTPRRPSGPPRPVAPDDDPTFLANLEQERRRRAREQRAAEKSGEPQDPTKDQGDQPEN